MFDDPNQSRKDAYSAPLPSDERELNGLVDALHARVAIYPRLLDSALIVAGRLIDERPGFGVLLLRALAKDETLRALVVESRVYIDDVLPKLLNNPPLLEQIFQHANEAKGDGGVGLDDGI